MYKLESKRDAQSASNGGVNVSVPGSNRERRGGLSTTFIFLFQIVQITLLVVLTYHVIAGNSFTSQEERYFERTMAEHEKRTNYAIVNALTSSSRDSLTAEKREYFRRQVEAIRDAISTQLKTEHREAVGSLKDHINTMWLLHDAKGKSDLTMYGIKP